MAALLALALLGGCPEGSLIQGQRDLPPTVEWLFQNQRDFDPVTVDSVPDLGETPVSDLESRLAGCWAFVDPNVSNTSFVWFSVYQFDDEGGTFTAWFLEYPLGFEQFRMLSRKTGTYEVVDGGATPAIRFTVTEFRGTDDTGELTVLTTIDTPDVGDAPAFTDGEFLYIQVEDTTDRETWARYRAIECLE